MKKLKLVLLVGLMALTAGMFGCSGDDGSAGVAGATGATGATGAPGADLTVATAEVRTAVATINSVSVDTSGSATNGNVVVLFSVKGGTLDPTTAAFTLAKMVPATLGSGNASHWVSYTARARTKDAAVTPIIQGYSEKASTGTLTDLDNGDWSYTFGLPNANVDGDITSNMNDAVNVSTVGTYPATFANVVTYEPSLLHRVGMEFKDTDGVRNLTNAFFDFVPDGSTAETRNIVTIDACNKCHGGERLHKGYTTQYCVTCHNTSTFNPATPAKADDPSTAITGTNATVALKVLVHKWHMGENLTDRDYRINAHNPTLTTFPQPVNNCTVCHNDDAAPGTLAQVDNWKTVPTMLACGACHDDVDFATGTNHGGGIQTNNSGCVVCHPATGNGFGKSVTDAHAITADVADTPEFDVTVTPSAPTSGTFYVAGETPTITVTLTNHADGSAVDPLFYTTAAGAEGVTTGTALSSAELFVYGSRTNAVPVLTPGSTTDATYDPKVAKAPQGVDLLDTTDVNVTSDATGFHYTLQAIPADMAAGTYMVQFQGADYGGITSTDYVTGSTGFATIQIGTATEEPKVAGDNCTNCHGASRMHLTGTHAHNVPFDTDYCLACHDQSGNYGDYIGNRVHAIHNANNDGDQHNRDWTDVTFPQPSSNCYICHSTSNDTWKTPIMSACAGCHGYDSSVSPAAAHMETNGGNLDLTAPQTLACLVCHDAGGIADLSVVHKLVAP